MQNPRFQRRLILTITSSLGRNEPQVPALPTHGKPPRHTCLRSHLTLSINRALKRTKAYSTLEDVRPTLRNKPSGLKADWHGVVKPRAPYQSPSPDLDDLDHTSLMLAISPPPSSSSSYGDIVPLTDAEARTRQGRGRSIVVWISSCRMQFGTHSFSSFPYLVLSRMAKAENNNRV